VEGDKNKKKKPSGLNNTVKSIVREKGGDKHVSVESVRDLDGGRVGAFTNNNDNNISLCYQNDCLLKCLYTNARSVINKMDEFVANVAKLQPDIIGITESWANDKILDAELSLNGNKGRGVLLYAKYNLDPVQFVPQTKFPEHVWCKVKSEDGIELLIGVL